MEVQYVFYALAAMLLIIALVRYLRRPEKHPAPVDVVMNEQGMVRITISAITATPTNGVNILIPDDLEGFIADLKPHEIHAILLESATGEYTERKRDVARVVTIAAGIYDFLIPLRLVMLDQRTHSFFNALMVDLKMTNIRVVHNGSYEANEHLRIHPGNYLEPDEHYLEQMSTIGHILIHFAMKQYYPSFKNFVATFQKNAKTHGRVYSHHDISSMATGYAAITGIPLPASYITYSTLAEQLLNSKAREKVKPVQLKLVKF